MAPYENYPLSFGSSVTPFADGKDRSPLQQAPPKPSQHTSWAQLALSCMPDFLHVVSLDGRIRYVTDSCKTVVGYERSQLLSRVVHDFVHPEELALFAREFTQIALHGVPTRFIYRFRAYDQSYIILEAQCNIYTDPSPFSGQRSLIINARPYNTRTNFLLDSFLEHKIVHDALERQMIDVECESAEEDDDSQTSIGIVESDTKTIDGVIVGFARPQGFRIHPSQLKPHVQLEFAYFEPQGHLADPIPVVSHGQDMSGVCSDEHELIGDLGIPFSPKTSSGVSKKKKKVQKSKMDYICMICSTTQSPEWRRGPQGPKTLCNSCGLRWAKSDRMTGQPTATIQHCDASRR